MQFDSLVSILGNDKRMDYIAGYLYDKGFEINRETDKISQSDIVIIEPGSCIDIPKLLGCLKPGTKLFLPKINLTLEKLCSKWKIQVFDYFGGDYITYENAKLTALGIVRIAKGKNAVLEESNCLLCGFGFCGKEIAKQLVNAHANVDVFVRRKDLRQQIEEYGCSGVLMSDIEKTSFDKYSYIFNTVPALIFTSHLLAKFSNNVIIFDIASLPGGVDDAYCNTHNIEVVHSLGIPGALYPKEAGMLVAKEIYNILYNVSDPICDYNK